MKIMAKSSMMDSTLTMRSLNMTKIWRLNSVTVTIKSVYRRCNTIELLC